MSERDSRHNDPGGYGNTALWELRWARFSAGLLGMGLVAGKHEFAKAWVRKFFKSIQPRKYDQAVQDDIEVFLVQLRGEGKKGWQVDQANLALEVFYRDVVPLEWAQLDWPKLSASDSLVLGGAAATSRPPLQSKGVELLQDRSDEGTLKPAWKKFLGEVQERLRAERYAYRTEQSYLDWIRRFLIFSSPVTRHHLTVDSVKEFLDYLSLVRRVSASTQNQAFNAILFLFNQVLKRELGSLEGLNSSPVSRKVPTVLTRKEVEKFLSELEGTGLLMAELMYGSGLRVMECVRLRVKDIDFGNGYIVVREGKGSKDRLAPLSKRVIAKLEVHLKAVEKGWQEDRKMGVEGVFLPDALARKYPKAAKEWG